MSDPTSPAQTAKKPSLLPRRIQRSQAIPMAGVLVVVLLALGYFFVVPTLQVNGYAKSSKPSHNEINDKMLLVYDNFTKPVFTSADTTAASDQIDIDSGKNAVKDANAILDANSATLTGFKPLPLMSWLTRYHNAQQLATDEKSYVSKSRAFLKDYSALLAYIDQSTAIEAKAETTSKNLQDNLQNASDVASLTKLLDSAVSQLQPLVDQEQALVPPSYLKDEQSSSLTDTKNFLNTLKDLSAAVKSLNVDQIQADGDKVNQEITDSQSADEKFVAALHKSSPIQLEINSLRDLHNKITTEYASF